MSQFNHLFASLPTPDTKYMQELNSIMYNFIWENKPSNTSTIPQWWLKNSIIFQYSTNQLKVHGTAGTLTGMENGGYVSKTK